MSENLTLVASERSEANGGERSEMARVWAFQTAVLACSAIVVFWGFYALDHFAAARAAGGAMTAQGPLQRYFGFDAQTLSNALSSLSGATTQTSSESSCAIVSSALRPGA